MFLYNHILYGIYFSLAISAGVFFVTGDHIGEAKFLQWFLIGFLVAICNTFIKIHEHLTRMNKS